MAYITDGSTYAKVDRWIGSRSTDIMTHKPTAFAVEQASDYPYHKCDHQTENGKDDSAVLGKKNKNAK